MWLVGVLVIIGLVVAAFLALVLVNTGRLDRANRRLVAELVLAAEPPAEIFRPEDLSGLPAPVQRYLKKAIPAGQRYVETVRLRQTGQFRLGDQTSPWKPLQAEQHFAVNPPGFVWDATIQMMPLVPVRVVDLYREGQGALQARVLSTLTVADSGASPEMNAGELMRYLAEAVWFPTALLPGQGVEWAPIDDRSARASITHQGNTASIIFHFNDRDEVERIHADRWYRRDDGEFDLVPWTGYWFSYQTRNGLLIPTEGRVEWNLPDGDLVYWQAALDEIDHILPD
jgi:hypothetical protein